MESWATEKLENETTMDEFYNKVLDSENILDSWLLVGTYLPIYILLLYLVVIKVGIRWMESKPPFELTMVMRIYNLFQIGYNCYLLSGFVYHPTGIQIALKKSCSADIAGDEFSDLRYGYLFYTWGFLVSKIIDLFDTVFMVLRKKKSHITFLHVYHHGAMVFFSWLTLRYAKAHQGVLCGMINVIVHVIMYTYYFMATFGPEVEKYLWWKKHLTKLQLTQFGVIILYLSVLYYNGCPIPKVFTYIWMFNMFVFLCLFINFYVRAYIFPPTTAQKEQEKHIKNS